MYKQHTLKMAKAKYPGGLRIIECEECAYTFAVEVDQNGIIKVDTKIQINNGDLYASHSFFQIPQDEPLLEISIQPELVTKAPK